MGYAYAASDRDLQNEHNLDYTTNLCERKVRMSHICKVEVSHFPVFEAGLECGRGIGDRERARAEPH